MRQVGSFPSQSDAERFAAYLLTQGVQAHAEEDTDGWAIWVRDEDQLEQARREIEQYRQDPQAERYRDVRQTAESILRNEQQRREKAARNVVVMRSRWRDGSTRKAPLVFVLIATCVLVSLWTSMGRNRQRFDRLAFCSAIHRAEEGWNEDRLGDVLVDIRRGQLWRLITPIFLHLGWMHLVFNVYWVYALGSQIEDRRGTLRLALLVLAIALISNVAQAWIDSPFFGGISGVVYGLFGYVWMKSLYDPGAGIHISRGVVIIFIVYFFLCLTGVFPVANTAHGAGLVVGVAAGYLPVLARSTK